jgi:hypothetical protein
MGHFVGGGFARLAYSPITTQGQELDGISESNLQRFPYNKIAFEFDDGLETVTLGEEVQTRLLKWLNEGSKKCINYSPNPLRLLSRTGKTFLESGQEESPGSNGYSFAYYVHRGMTDFTGIGFITMSDKVSLSKLKHGDLVVLKSNKKKYVLQAMLYIGNEIFMSMIQGVIYFQNLEQITLLWDPEQDSSLELVDTIASEESLRAYTNETKVDSIEASGYMRPVDMLLPPPGSYIK